MSQKNKKKSTKQSWQPTNRTRESWQYDYDREYEYNDDTYYEPNNQRPRKSKKRSNYNQQPPLQCTECYELQKTIENQRKENRNLSKAYKQLKQNPSGAAQPYQQAPPCTECQELYQIIENQRKKNRNLNKAYKQLKQNQSAAAIDAPSQQEIHRLQTQINSMKASYKAQFNTLKQKNSDLEQKSNSINELKKEIATLRKEKKTMKANTAKNKELQKKIDNLTQIHKQEIKAMENKMAALKKVNKDLRSRLGQIPKNWEEIKKQNQNLKKVQKQRQEQQNRANNLLNKLKKQKEIEQEYKKKLAVLNKSNNEYMRDIGELQMELAETKSILLEQNEEEQKMKEEENELNLDLMNLRKRMNIFNTKYSDGKLVKIYDHDDDLLLIKQEILNTNLVCDALKGKLTEIDDFIDNVTKPDISKYDSWDINTTMAWIKTLDEGEYMEYCEVLRVGFESDGITAADLPNITQHDLATEPFNIRSFKHRKQLALHFKSLQIQTKNEEGTVTDYH